MKRFFVCDYKYQIAVPLQISDWRREGVISKILRREI
jgi:hypothetical protein